MRRRPIAIDKKMPLVRSQKELALDEETSVGNFMDEDTINTVEEQTKLKDIPVPLSLSQERAAGTTSFRLPEGSFIGTPPPNPIPVCEREEVDWDIDAEGFRFLKALNRGEKGYTGPQVDEATFEKVIDRFEKSVKADIPPDLGTLESRLASLVPDRSVIKLAYAWWVERRKTLAMPLIRELRPPPDPEDPDTTGVAFRPREKEGIRRMRSNNKKTYNLMSQLHAELVRLQQIAQLIKQRELTKLELHRANGDYTEAAHRTLVHRLSRQRTGGVWKDDLDEMHEPREAREVRSVGHHKKMAPIGTATRLSHKTERSHKKRHHGLPGAPATRRDGYGSTHHTVGRPRGRHAVEGEEEARRVRHAERVSAIDDLDSEEEAYRQMVLSVDTAKRDALVRFLPPHLRAVVHRALAEPVDGASAETTQKGEADGPPAEAPASAEAGVIRLRGQLRIGRGGRVIFDRGGRGGGVYIRSCMPRHFGDPASNLPPLLAHVLMHGRLRAPVLRAEQMDPDAAWRQNRPLQIKRSPLLFDFKSLPKPDLVGDSEGDSCLPAADDGVSTETGNCASSPQAESSHRVSSNGRKRKMPDDNVHESA